ncbi:MAG: hypothetical protein AB9869_21010 [Verrucomicrobiia bacterium]
MARTGERKRQADEALSRLVECGSCPRRCQVDRLHDQTGFSRIGRSVRVASHFPPHDEENWLRGRNGSDTIFFSGCNLRCVFCQNYDMVCNLSGKAFSCHRGPFRTVAIELFFSSMSSRKSASAAGDIVVEILRELHEQHSQVVEPLLRQSTGRMRQSLLVLGKKAAQRLRHLGQILIPAAREATWAMLGEDVSDSASR